MTRAGYDGSPDAARAFLADLLGVPTEECAPAQPGSRMHGLQRWVAQRAAAGVADEALYQELLEVLRQQLAVQS